MNNVPIPLNPHAMRLGLGWAQSWTEGGPVLCIISANTVRLVVVRERRFIATWEWPEETESPYRFFLMPPFIASTLAGHDALGLSSMRVRVNRTHVALTVRDRHGEYVLEWRWRAQSFEAPAYFEQMADPPGDLRHEDYLKVSDAVHLAIANLGRLEMMDDVNRRDLAIMVDFAPGQFRIDGQPIMLGGEARYFFDPRLIVRGLEVVRGDNVGFALDRTTTPGQAILYMSSQRASWRIHCAMLSMLPTEQTEIVRQREYPLAQTGQLTIREKMSF